jgi:hypothetical protein
MRFALILLTALLLPSPEPSPKPQPATATGDTHKAEADHKGTQDDPLVVHIKGTEQSEKEASYNKNKDDREDKRKIYDLLLTGVIAFAAIAQFVTAIVQACIYRKQSSIMVDTLEATQISADAARINAAALTNAERAWVLVDRSRNNAMDTWIFEFEAKNWGQSPAEILSTCLKADAIDWNADLPNTPNYEVDAPVPDRRWVPPGEPFDIGHFSGYAQIQKNDPDAWTNLQAGKKRLWVYGIICYRDTISQGKHETRFCYWKVPGSSLAMGGPDQYNQCT